VIAPGVAIALACPTGRHGTVLLLLLLRPPRAATAR